MTQTLANLGGIFALLVLNHFVVDWVFQTHTEAMKKSTSALWRARHCLVYATGFIPLLWLLGLSWGTLGASWGILFVSHFFEDTYWPVFLWAKYIRRMPAIRDIGLTSNGRYDRQTKERAAFKELFSTPLGVVLFITIDQIIHLLFLLPVAAFAV